MLSDKRGFKWSMIFGSNTGKGIGMLFEAEVQDQVAERSVLGSCCADPAAGVVLGILAV